IISRNRFVPLTSKINEQPYRFPADRALVSVQRGEEEESGHKGELAKGDEALRPFLLACETKHLKLITIAIGCIQKLISFRAIPETSVRTILRTLNDVIVHGVEIQLKILQTVLPLLTNYDSVHDEVLAEALLICFRLQDSKIVVVNNTAAATLRQLVIFTFDKVAKEDNAAAALPPEKDGQHPLGATPVGMANETTVYLRPCAKDAYYLFQDLCILTNGEHPVYLRLNHLSRTFGLELIESVLTNHFKLFRKHTEFSSLLRERVCPLIIKNMSDKHDFPQTMRLTRVVYILIKQFNEILVMECEIFLSMFVKILEPENPLWQRVLSMEIFRGVCGDPLLLRSIFAWYDRQDRSTNVFRDMISAFGKLAAERPQLVGATQGGRESLDYGTGGPGGTQGYYQHYAGAGEPGL
ncbi:guanine nucleotide exchange factor in Golgi transport N-terminal-domain-containing protein, partial [Jimgerdemannia flammicorona]